MSTIANRVDRIPKCANVVLAIFALSCATWRPAAAYVPPSEAAAEFHRAMDDLTPFLGIWEGQIEFQGRMVKIHRKVAKGLGDVIYLRLHDSEPDDVISLLTFDVDERKYKLLIPGFRPLDACYSTAELVQVFHPDSQTLQWTEYGLPQCGTTRTTIVVQNGTWQETSEFTRTDGSKAPPQKFVLKREGAASLEF